MWSIDIKDRALLVVVAIIFLAAGFVAGLAVGRRQGPELSPTERFAQKILGDADGRDSVDGKRATDVDALKKAVLKKLDMDLRKTEDGHRNGK